MEKYPQIPVNYKLVFSFFFTKFNFTDYFTTFLLLRHRYAPCTGVVAQPPDFASVGEDGNLNLYRLMYNMPYKTIGVEENVAAINFHI